MGHALKAYLLLTIAILSWSGNTIVARMLHTDISAIALSAIRWWLATLLVLPFVLKYLRQDWHRLLEHRYYLALMGLLGVSLFNTLLYQAAHTTTSTQIALIQTSMPAIILVLSAWLFAEKTHALAIVGVILSMLGAMLVIARGELATLLALDMVAGDMIMLLANLVYALYSVLLKKMPPIHPLSFVGATFIGGSLFMLPLLAWDLQVNPLPTASSGLLYSFIYVAVFPSIVAYLCWNGGVKMVGAGTAGFFFCLIPLFTAVLARILLDEALAWYHIASMVMILAGFMLFQSRQSGLPDRGYPQ